MENYDKVLEYTTTSMEASGSAAQRYETYLDSIDAKVNQLTASWEQMVIDFNGSDLYADFVDMGTKGVEILDFLLNKINLLDVGFGALQVAGVTAIAKITEEIVNGFGTASQIVNNLTNGMNSINTMDKISKMSKPFQYLNTILLSLDTTTGEFDQTLLKTIMTQRLGSEAAADAAMKTTTFSAAQASATIYAAMATASYKANAAGLTGISKAATIAKSGVVSAFNAIGDAILKHPVMATVSVITMAIMAVKKYYDYLEERSQEMIQTASDIASEYGTAVENINSNISTVEGLKTEYSELANGVDSFGNNLSLTADEYERYKQIVSQVNGMVPDSLRGYAEENNLLQDKNALLDDTITLLERQAKIEAQLATSGTKGDDYFAGTIETYKEGMKNVEDMTKGTNIFNALDDAIKEGTPKNGNLFGNAISTMIDEKTTRQQVVDALGSVFSNVDVGEIFNKYVETGYTNPEMFTFLEDNAEYISENIDSIITSLSKNWPEDMGQDSLEVLITSLRGFSTDFDNYSAQAETSAEAFKQYWYDWMDGWTDYGQLGVGAQQIVQSYVDGLDPIVMETKHLREQTEEELTALVNSFANKLSDGSTVSEALGNLTNLKLSLPVDQWIEQFDDAWEEIQKAAGWTDEQAIEIKAKLGFDFDESRIDKMKEEVQNAFDFEIDFDSLTVEQLEVIVENLGNTMISTATNTEELQNAIVAMNTDFDALMGSVQASVSSLSDLENAISDVSSIVNEYNETGYLTLSNLDTLLSDYPEYLQYLSLEGGQLTFNTTALKEQVYAELQEAKSKAEQAVALAQYQYQAAAAAYAEEQLSDAADEADSTLNNMGNTAQTVGGKLANLASEALKAAAATAFEKYGGTDDFETYMQTYTDSLNQAQGQLDAINATINNFGGAWGVATSSGTSVVSDATDAWKAEFEEYYDELQYLRDMDKISEEQYYQELDRLNQKYFANREEYLDEYRQYQVEVYQGLKKLREQQQKEEEEAEKEYWQNKIDGVDDQIDALNKQKEALREKNEQAQLELDLQKAKDRYDAAKNTRNVRRYTEEKFERNLIVRCVERGSNDLKYTH